MSYYVDMMKQILTDDGNQEFDKLYCILTSLVSVANELQINSATMLDACKLSDWLMEKVPSSLSLLCQSVQTAKHS